MSTAAYPIGTVVRQSGTIPISYDACSPDKAPPEAIVPSLFPSYKISHSASVDFGLSNDLFSKIADAGIKYNQSTGSDIGFKNTKINVLSDEQVTSLIGKEACRTTISSQPALIVRGYISGQRKFTISSSNSASAKASLVKVANLDVSPGTNERSIEISDATEVGFLQIVSQISTQTGGGAVISKPVAVIGSGKVYVQRDVADTSGLAAKVSASLKEANFKVVPQVEALPSKAMPNRAQVRYFNESDKTVAEKAAIELAKHFPGASAVRISLPSPPGQLEVWLPKATN